MQVTNQRVVLVTGAAGFVGKYVVSEALRDSCPLAGLASDGAASDVPVTVVALDTLAEEVIAKTFSFHPSVIPLQLDLTQILNDLSQERMALLEVLSTVQSVIHLAAIVDTRESRQVRNLIMVRTQNNIMPSI